MDYKQPTFFGQVEDGLYKGLVEQIESSKEYDILDMSNRRRNLLVLSLFNGYRQIGQYKINKPHHFNEGDLVIITVQNNKVINVEKETITISNTREIFKN